MPPPQGQQEFSDCTALVVDDTPINRELMFVLLETQGIGRIDTAADGVEALDRVARQMPDIVLLDIMMPRMDGLEFLTRFRANPDWADIPVLVTTALNDSDDRARAFDRGATDYVAKPIDRRELTARVGVHLRNRLMMQSLKTYRDRLQQDLAIATAMQAALLPSADQLESCARRYGRHLAAVTRPSSEVSGDLWGWFPLDSQRFAVWLADFSGHGVAAAINTFRLHVILGSGPGADPAALLTRLNESLVDVLPRGQFATMLYAVCDTVAETLVFSSAGATAPIVIAPDGRARLHPASSLPLGVRRATVYGNVELAFPKGAALMLYSDGLSEAADPTGKHLGEEAVMELAAELKTAGDVTGLLPDMAQRGVTFADDVSVLWLGG
ncbi:PP2C family protein-serine/threonine phosphatase [Magnetospirillum moscoviense]|uniref:Response regulatory domain-containing protein n=1 Tax=Magnetospirillum moscoviense TaxID=1437059 RepID=A0A178MW17_9PROT|nr:fused response regulator/phosphatase [Magnetospirillum moscoviense]OAN53237.1 hypothetical protein A6A05_09835 [Magnetospirillum moscoviense]